MRSSFQHIVIGAGALGSATAYRLAKAGARDVLVLEQFELGHDKGASEDHSRVIRHAYHSTAYTALTPAMFSTWSEVEEESGLTLVTTTGELDLAVAGTDGEAEMDNYRRILAPGVSAENLDASEIRRRWPQWQIEDDVVGMFQEDGGILDIGRAVRAHIGLARERGVVCLPNTRVTGVASGESHVTVHTTDQSFTAESVIMCVASWASALLADLGINWQIALSQEQVSYFATPHVGEFSPDRFPMWIWHGETTFYGFPIYGVPAIKIARDLSGRWVTTESRSYDADPDETKLLERFLLERLPGAVGPELMSKTCVYDLPPDRDFILDKLPGHPRITIGMGAAHAAKFASLIGVILAGLAIDGHTSYPIGAFRADRPALSDPSFTPAFRIG